MSSPNNTYFIFSPRQQEIASIDYIYDESYYNDDLINVFEEIPEIRIKEFQSNTFINLDNIISDIFKDAEKVTDNKHEQYRRDYLVNRRLCNINITIIHNMLHVLIEYKELESEKDKEELFNDIEYIKNTIINNYKLITIIGVENEGKVKGLFNGNYSMELLFDGYHFKKGEDNKYKENLKIKLSTLQKNKYVSFILNFIAYQIFIIHFVFLCCLGLLAYNINNHLSNISRDLNMGTSYQLIIEDKVIEKYHLNILNFKIPIVDQNFIIGKRLDNQENNIKLRLSKRIYNHKDIGNIVNIFKTNYNKEPYISEGFYHKILSKYEYNGFIYYTLILIMGYCLLFIFFYLVSIPTKRNYKEFNQFIVKECTSTILITAFIIAIIFETSL